MSDAEYGKLVHWSSVRVNWNGAEHFELRLTTAIEEGPSLWLGHNLAIALGTELGALNVLVEPAVRSEAGFKSFGEIAIGGLRHPFPEPRVLQGLITRAVHEAHEKWNHANWVAVEWTEQLKKLG